MADKNKGWIKLYRSLQDNVIWQDSAPFDDRSAWIDLLMMVNHEDKEIKVGREIIKVKAGQKWTSIKHLADRWHWSREKTYRYTKMLKKCGMIYTDATPNGTLLTVVNWGFFNGMRTNETQTRSIKNIKNVKNEKDNKAPGGDFDEEDQEWQ